MQLQDFKIIQGGMGIHVSSWRLAKAVSMAGQLGVVSGTAIDSVVARVLQLGDRDGHIRRALDHFPFADVAHRVRDRFFEEGGKPSEKPYKGIGMPAIAMNKAKAELLMVANFVEVFLAKEQHKGAVGINYLEKIQLPTLPSLFGAMLAGVNVVLMGAGIPTAIPGVLDDLADWNPVSLRIQVEGLNTDQPVFTHFDPSEYLFGERPHLTRPAFLAIVSTDVVARQMERKATGVVDGYVVENHTAGGHNAPPRRDRNAEAGAPPSYGDKDIPDLGKIAALGKPFWLAGRYTTPDRFQEARAAGATGVQVGTPFAFCDESAMDRAIKDEVIAQSIAGTLSIETSFIASPTGYPFKLLHLKGDRFTVENVLKRKRVCDMGYLRSAYADASGKIGWRCPAEPVDDYIAKGGTLEETEGRMCLCNGLAATVGYGQLRRNDAAEAPILTSGDEALEVHKFLQPGQKRYSAQNVIDSILA